MKESALITKIQKALRERGAYVYKSHGSQFGVAGTPDLLCCVGGRFLALEVKVGTNDTTELQQQRINEIRRAGGSAVVVRSVEEAVDAANDVF